jgi:hypothetical protein
MSEKPLTTVKFGRNEEIPQLWDFAHNTAVVTSLTLAKKNSRNSRHRAPALDS